MDDTELWIYFWNKKIAFAKPFDREFLWVSREDFEHVKNLFIKEFNFIHKEDSYRSAGYISHLHAVIQGEVIFIHKDTGNIARFFPLGILHLFCDVFRT